MHIHGNEWFGMCFLPKFFSYEHHYKTEIVQFIFLFSLEKKTKQTKTITIKKRQWLRVRPFVSVDLGLHVRRV